MAQKQAPRRTAPHPFKQWDEAAARAACTAQLLVMHGLLRPDFIRSNFDRQIGRRSTQDDAEAGCLRRLLGYGFEVVEAIAEDVDGTAADPERQALARLKVPAKYRSQYQLQPREATGRDITYFLWAGYCVIVKLPRAGSVAPLLITSNPAGNYTYLIYDPASGIVESATNLHELPRLMQPTLEAYRLPAR